MADCYLSRSASTVCSAKEYGLTREEIDKWALLSHQRACAAIKSGKFKELGITEKDYDKVNVNGSCVALGHPLGATGARILTTLLHEMRRRGARYGLIAICGGGGMGICGTLQKA